MCGVCGVCGVVEAFMSNEGIGSYTLVGWMRGDEMSSM
jgi:hypothetical protein